MCGVQRILCTELLQRLMDFQPGLARAVALAAEVDCLVSLTQAARDHGYCRPILTQDNVLHIKQGAYPFGFQKICHNSKATGTLLLQHMAQVFWSALHLGYASCLRST